MLTYLIALLPHLTKQLTLRINGNLRVGLLLGPLFLTNLAWGTSWITLEGPLNIYESRNAAKALKTLGEGEVIKILDRGDGTWVHIAYEGDDFLEEQDGYAQMSDLKIALKRREVLGRDRAQTPKRERRDPGPLSRRWGGGVGLGAGYGFQAPQTLSQPPVEGDISTFQGTNTGLSLYLDIPFVPWLQWRVEYLSHQHDMEAQSVNSNGSSPMKFERVKSYSTYHLQLKSYSFQSKKWWQGLGLLYMKPHSATIKMTQDNTQTTMDFEGRELAPQWGASYSVGFEWVLFDHLVIHPQVRATLQFSSPATLESHLFLFGGFSF